MEINGNKKLSFLQPRFPRTHKCVIYSNAFPFIYLKWLADL